MQFTSVFQDIVKFADFRRKNADISRNQEMFHWIKTFLGFLSGNVPSLITEPSFNIVMRVMDLKQWGFFCPSVISVRIAKGKV